MQKVDEKNKAGRKQGSFKIWSGSIFYFTIKINFICHLYC